MATQFLRFGFCLALGAIFGGAFATRMALSAPAAAPRPPQAPDVKAPDRTPRSPRTDAPRPTKPAAFVIDAKTSRVSIKVGAEGYGHPHGVGGRIDSGKVDFAGPGDLVFDMKSMVADLTEDRARLGLTKRVSQSDQRKVTEAMLGSDVLDVARFPRAFYAISAIAPLDGQAVGDPGRYQVDGNFTLRGVKRPLQVLGTLERTDRPGVLRMQGACTIVQSQFGITPYSALGGLVRVADRLDVRADLVLVSSPP